MYFTFGWPRILRVPQADESDQVSQVVANRDKILFAVLTHSSLSIWTSRPCLAAVGHQRSRKSLEKLGSNTAIIWKPDSTALVVMTSGGYLLFYCLSSNSAENIYDQIDSDNPKLRRESDILFPKEPIPSLILQLEQEIAVQGHKIGTISLFRDEIMVSTDENNHILRYRWDGTVNRDFCIDLRRIPFSVDQQVLKAIPLQESNIYVIDLHYSPLIGGFSLVLSDGRSAFLTATTKGYDPNSVQGIWATNLDDVTCSNVNHKYRLISFGRKNSETAVFSLDEQTGGLNYIFNLKLSSKDFPGSPGSVVSSNWTPDGCAIAVSWDKGGFGLWSVFGSLLTCSLSWTSDFSPFTQRRIKSLDWSAEGYSLWVAFESNLTNPKDSTFGCDFAVISFMKSALIVNPAMSQIEHMYLQGEDRLMIFLSVGDSLNSSNFVTSNSTTGTKSPINGIVAMNGSAIAIEGDPGNKPNNDELKTPRASNKNWVTIPYTDVYLAANWPIRYTAIDAEGLYVGLSGRYGLAFYSIPEKKWKLFGNEAQERDFVVTGGMLWWNSFLIVSVYDIPQDRVELRFYHRDQKLNNQTKLFKSLPSQILLLSVDRDKLLVFCADSTLAICQLKSDSMMLEALMTNPDGFDPCDIIQTIDLSGICVHPACVVSSYLTTLKNSFSSNTDGVDNHSLIINISGRLMLLHHDYLIQENSQASAPQYITPTVLASNVELIWLPRNRNPSISQHHGGVHPNPYLSEALWLYCGQEMRVWLPLREKSKSSQVHTFISNRIMLGFPISIYPLTILFERALILGVENDSPSYICSATYPSSSLLAGQNMFPYPFCILQRTSQVYLHQIFRQLIRRNLGYYAWEIARSCSKLPYFHHSLELLLHEVLEEEATSKEPIPDALLPPVIEFVREFPIYLRTVGQCARKTELALWGYLFNVAGRPRALFEECLKLDQLDNASTYLLIIQNLESSSVSRKCASQLLDKALEAKNWDLIKDLVRFLKAIDPSEADTPRNSLVKFANNMTSPPLSPNEYDISMVLGSVQVPRNRSLSTSVVPKFHRELTRAQSDGHGHRNSIFVLHSSNSNSPNSTQNSPGISNNIQ